MRYFALVFLLLAPASASAAGLTLAADAARLAPGQSALVTVTLDPEGQDVNGLDGSIILPDSLAAESVSIASSVVGFWVTAPRVVDDHRIEFAGVMPGGYRGDLSPNWVGYRPGTVFTFVVRAQEAGADQVFVDPATEMYLGDGEGTRLPFRAAPVKIVVAGDPLPRGIPASPAADSQSPEPFRPSVMSDAALYEGANVVVWHASDSGSGIRDEEVAETRWRFLPVSFLSFRPAVSPERLADQELLSMIYVRVTDAAGNGRVESIAPSRVSREDWLTITFFFLGILLLYLFARRVRVSRIR